MKTIHIILTCTLFLFLSCAAERPKGKTEAEVLFKEAKEMIVEGRYILANERLNQLRSQYPYSYYSTHAELLQADILFEQENYVESASAYTLFRDLHPTNKRMDYVNLRIAESYYKQIPSTFDRDLTPAHQAIKYYNELLRNYPGSKLIKDALERIKECQDLIEQKEKYIADFYYKTDVFGAARYRYLDILARFPNNKVLRNHAIRRVLVTSVKLEDFKGCANYFNQFESLIDPAYKRMLQEIYKTCQNNITKE